MMLTLRESQKRLIDMGKTIHNILEKHNISYMITFGTLLGAVRHKGFIPWDDDFDLFIFDGEYEQAIKYLREECPDDMFVEDGQSEGKYFHAWAHVKDKNTIAVCEQFPQDNIYEHKGLSIDLYRAVPMKESDVDLYRLKENLEYQKRKRNVGLVSNEEFIKLEKKISAEIEKEKEKTPVSNKLVFGMVVKEKMMYVDEVLPLKLYSFEDTMFWGPKDYDSVLKRFYGDYLILPEEKERTAHYSKVERIN